MQHFRFTITDYTVNPAGDSSIIDEPVGWDGLEMKLSRHPDWHGFFDYFNSAITMLQFDGTGFAILKAAWEGYGMDSKVELVIEFACSDTDAYDELYTGKFDFALYKQHCGDRCYIEIHVETTSCLIQFKNRYDQKVDIETLRTFDLPDGDPDDLAAYTGIDFDMPLTPKLIVLKSWWDQVEATIDTYLVEYPDATLINQYVYSPQMQYSVSDIDQSIGGVFTHVETGNPYTLSNGGVLPFPWIDILPGQFATYNNVYIDMYIQGSFEDLFDIGDGEGSYESGLAWFLQLKRGLGDFSSSTLLVSIPIASGILSGPYGGGSGSAGDDFSGTFSVGMTTTIPTLSSGEKIYIVLLGAQYTGIGDGGTGDLEFRRIINFTIDNTSYIHITSDTVSESTDARVYLINEVASRATEAITNDCLRVYSDLLGRTDAQPYASAQDGCAALEVVTNGLLIRQASLQDGSTPTLTLSMKQVFEALNAVWNIGMGVEDDPNRPGYQWLRIEKFQYFYDTTVLATFDKIAQVTKTANEKSFTSVFKVGYSKWEAEQFNGLDEFLTKREFRTTLSSVNNELQKLCDFIASGYAIEVTRRQIGPSSKDWRYDNDTFLICVVRNGGDLEVENDTINAANIIDPPTVYNTRISPARNARRWMLIVFQCYVDYTSGVLKFITGDGNIVAQSTIVSADAACSVEDVTTPKPVTENADIDYTLFDPANVADYYPIFKPERVTFEYPLTYAQWKTIKAHPTGLIGYQCGNGATAYGWIDELSYKPVDGMAEFTLIPKQPGLISEGGG